MSGLSLAQSGQSGALLQSQISPGQSEGQEQGFKGQTGRVTDVYTAQQGEK